MRKIATITGLFGIFALITGNTMISGILAPQPDSSILSQTALSSYNTTADTIVRQNDSFNADDFAALPEYCGQASVIVNNNIPYFTAQERAAWTAGTEVYSEMDALGRCGTAYACIGLETMPGANETRGSIGMVKPSGWHTVKYPELIDDLYLYNRCHLIGWQLGNENANEKNLITGTRYLNVTGMLPYENMVADYVRNSGNHVLYRVSPYFVGKELVARGVLMEAESVEDTRISFCVWCYNVQPGITIDYTTGGSVADPNATAQLPAPTTTPTTASQVTTPSQSSVSVRTECTYILNTNTKRIHLPTCSSVNEMKPSNRKEFSGDVTCLLEQGYKACGRCHPF